MSRLLQLTDRINKGGEGESQKNSNSSMFGAAINHRDQHLFLLLNPRFPQPLLLRRFIGKALFSLVLARRKGNHTPAKRSMEKGFKHKKKEKKKYKRKGWQDNTES